MRPGPALPSWATPGFLLRDTSGSPSLERGEVLNITEKKTPVLLSGDDETVEITWNSTLEPGVYQLQTALIGQDGSIIDLQENIIEAKPIVRSSPSDEVKSSGLPAGLAGVAMLAIILFRRMRDRAN